MARLGADRFADEARFFRYRRRIRAEGGPIGQRIELELAERAPRPAEPERAVSECE